MAQFDETFDWVVVGSGAGSMTSTLVMRSVGKSVVVLEKADLFGGTTAKSGGVMWVPANRFMKEAGVEDSAEAAERYLDGACDDGTDAPGSTPLRRKAYIVESAKMIDFLVGQGLELERGSKFWPDYYDRLPGGCKTSRTVVAAPFDKKVLGPWAEKLRKGFMPVIARHEEAGKLQFFRKSWEGKRMMVRVALRMVLARLAGKQMVTAGAALQGRLLKIALDAGVDIRLGSPVDELVMDGDRVTGVRITVDGEPRRIGARLGVLVNAGGFARNQDMRDRYMPMTRAEWSNAIETDTGEMLVEMERAGGVLAQMDQMVGCPMTRAPGWEDAYLKPPVQNLTGKPHAILVDGTGVRYMNESVSYELYCETMLARHRSAPAVPSWALFDSQFIDQYMLANTMPGRRKPASWIESGYLKQASSIAELAGLIGVAPDVLRSTVGRWNGFVDRGRDEDFQRGEGAYDAWLGDPFNKPNPSFGRIDKGPYYAVEVVPGDFGTYGGIVADHHARVLNARGEPVAGLYATGVSTASVMGGVYPGAGASVGPSATFGYIAAKHSAGLMP